MTPSPSPALSGSTAKSSVETAKAALKDSLAPLAHPLSDITPQEMTAVVGIVTVHCEKEFGAMKFVFNGIMLREPETREVDLFASAPEKTYDRRADVVLIQYEDGTGQAVECIVNLTKSRIDSWKALKGVQPTITPEDCDLLEQIVRDDVRVQEHLKEHNGITDTSMLICDPWSYGFCGDGLTADRRIVQAFLYYRFDDERDNQYAHPIDATPVVDLVKKEVIKIDTQPKPYRVRAEKANYHRDLTKFRAESGKIPLLKPLEIVQREGPSFTVEDSNLVTWDRWTFRVGFNYRDGVVLRNLTLKDDDGTDRPTFHRIALNEMAVPYGDPNVPYVRKCAFDVGDYGLGYCANSLELGCDCLGYIHYFDACMVTHSGEPRILKKAICMHEEDDGLLWKHVEYRNGHSEARRSRKLVISFISTVVNYEYAMYYELYQDGTINFNIKATGMLSTNALSECESDQDQPKYGVYVMPGVNAQVHQHMFCARIDPCIDGAKNSLVEVNVKAAPDAGTQGNAFYGEETVFDTEDQVKRNLDINTARYWKVVNESKLNPITLKPVAFKLMPRLSTPLLAAEGSNIGNRAAFARKSLWTTAYSAEERYAAGEYPNQYAGGAGVTEWSNQGRSIRNESLVMWHVFGLTHLPRIEDFPVMPVEVTGFALKPNGFFTQNPANDLPPASDGEKACSCEDRTTLSAN
eukprot:Clim_evm25s144 gene=Clim_evmTU25s144